MSLLSSSYFGGHNSSNVARVSFTSVDTLYVTLNTSPVGWEGLGGVIKSRVFVVIQLLR